MTCESQSQQKLKSETTGAKSIKKCARCKRWDDVSILIYDGRNAFYYHRDCHRINGRNINRIKNLTDKSTLKLYFHPKIGKCQECGQFDCKDNFYQYNKRKHPKCTSIQTRNSKKMKPHKTDTCAFTGLPFGPNSETRPVGDHDHDTLLYRGHIWSAANRLEGAAKFIMDEAGWTVDELCNALKSYLAKPGIDIGLEPYPQLGFATPEEAEQHYGNQI